jgi:DNA-directed RNA polymerase alpha subunit
MFDRHSDGCEPRNPCKYCRALTFLRSKIDEEDLATYLAILSVDEPETSAGLPRGATPEMDIPIEDLGLSLRACNALRNRDKTRVWQVLQEPESYYARPGQVYNFGKGCLTELKAALKKRGWRLGQVSPSS